MRLFARFGDPGRKHRPASLWETAAEYGEPFYDPAESAFDPLGSYTGKPADDGYPEQDADDL